MARANVVLIITIRPVIHWRYVAIAMWYNRVAAASMVYSVSFVRGMHNGMIYSGSVFEPFGSSEIML